MQPKFELNFINALSELDSKKIPFVQMTLISAKGSTPNQQGAKALVTQESLFWGTIGGGKVEAKAIEVAKSLLENPNPKIQHHLLHWNLQRDVGMTCGGEVQIFFEIFAQNSWTIVIFGAGHVAQKLVPIVCEMATVHVVDTREEWLKLLKPHNSLTLHHHSIPSELVDIFSPQSFFVLMSQGHATDLPVLEKILKSKTPPPYCGVIGSLSKKLTLQRELRELGIVDEQILNSFHCPIGLQMGQSSPAEIAVSVSAQLLQCRDHFWNESNLASG